MWSQVDTWCEWDWDGCRVKKYYNVFVSNVPNSSRTVFFLRFLRDAPLLLLLLLMLLLRTRSLSQCVEYLYHPSLDSFLCNYQTWIPSATTTVADAMDVNAKVSLRYPQPFVKIYAATSDDVFHGFTTPLYLYRWLVALPFLPTYTYPTVRQSQSIHSALPRGCL